MFFFNYELKKAGNQKLTLLQKFLEYQNMDFLQKKSKLTKFQKKNNKHLKKAGN